MLKRIQRRSGCYNLFQGFLNAIVVLALRKKRRLKAFSV
jgi:hypothetical protein